MFWCENELNFFLFFEMSMALFLGFFLNLLKLTTCKWTLNIFTLIILKVKK